LSTELLELKIDVTGVNKLQSVSQALDKIAVSAKNLQGPIAHLSSSYNGMIASLNGMAQAAQKFNQQNSSLVNQINKLSAAQLKLSAAQATHTNSTHALGSAFEKAKSAASFFQTGLEAVASATVKTGQVGGKAILGLHAPFLAAGQLGVAAFQKISGAAGQVIGQIEKVGTRLAQVGAIAAAGLGVKLVKDFSDFQAELKTTQAVLGTTDVLAMDKFKRQALELSAQFHVTAGQVASSYTVMAKAGYDEQQILAAAPGLMKLVIAGNLDMATAADYLTGTLRMFHMEASDASKATDILSLAANKSSVDISDIAKTMEFAGPIAQAMGYSLNDTAAAVALLGNDMIRSSKAGTTMRAIMQRMVTGTGGAGDAMKELGVSAVNADGSIKPLQKTLDELRVKFKGLTQEKQIDLSKKIAGVPASAGFLTLMNKSQQEFDTMFDDLNNHFEGSADKLVTIMRQGVRPALISLWSSFQTLGIRAIDSVSGPLEYFLNMGIRKLNSLGPAAESFGRNFEQPFNTFNQTLQGMGAAIDRHNKKLESDNPKAIQKSIEANNAWAAAIYKASGIYSEYGKKLDGTGLQQREFLDFFENDFLPAWDKAVPAIQAVTKVFNPLSIAMDTFTGYVRGGTIGALDAFSARIGAMGGVISYVAPLIVNKFIGALDQVEVWFHHNSQKILNNAFDFFSGVMKFGLPAATSIIADLSSMLNEVISWIRSNTNRIGNALLEWATSFINWNIPILGPLISNFEGMLAGILAWVNTNATTILNRLSRWAMAFVDWAGPIAANLFDRLGDLVVSVLNWISNNRTAILNKLSMWATAFVEWAAGLAGRVINAAGNVISGVLGWIGDNAGRITAKLGEWTNSFITWAGQLSSKIYDSLKNTFNDIGKAIGLDEGFKSITDGLDSIVNGYKKLFSALDDIIHNQGIVNTVLDVAGSAAKLFGEAISTVAEVVKTNLPTIQTIVEHAGGVIKTAFDIATEVVKNLVGPLNDVFTLLKPFAGIIGDVAGAFIVYKIAAEGAALATRGLALAQGALGLAGMTSNVGFFAKAVWGLVPAFAAWEGVNAATNGELDKTKDKLLWLMSHQDEVAKVTGYKSSTPLGSLLNSIGDPGIAKGVDEVGSGPTKTPANSTFSYSKFLKEGTANNQVFAAANKIASDYANTLQQTTTSVSKFYEAESVASTNTKNLAQSVEAHRSRLQALNEQLDLNDGAFARLPAAMQDSIIKSAQLTGQMNGLAQAMDNTARANDALAQKLSSVNQVSGVLDTAVAQLSLKTRGQTIAFDGQNLALDQAYGKWKDLTAVQLAGGKGAFDAGVQAGKLKDAMVTMAGQGLSPVLDLEFKNIGATQDLTKEYVDNTLKAAQQAEQQNKNADSLKQVQGATNELAKVSSNSGAVIRESGLAGATGFTAVKDAADKAKQGVDTYNTTSVEKKTAETNFATIAIAIQAAVGALNLWNSTNVNSKSATFTANYAATVTGGAPTIIPGGSGNGSGGGTPPKIGVGPGAGGGNKKNDVNSRSLSSFDGSRLGGAASGASQMVDAVAQATTTAQTAALSVASLKSQIDEITNLFKSLDGKALKVASDQADMVGKLASAAGNVTDALEKIRKSNSVSKTVMDQFGHDMQALVQVFIDAAAKFNKKMLDGSALFVDTAGKVGDAASKVLDALTKLQSYAYIGKDVIYAFGQDVFSLVAEFYNASVNFSKDMLDSANNFTDTASKVADAAGKMVDSLNKIRHWAAVGKGYIWAFNGDVLDLVAAFYNTSVQYFTPTMLEAANNYSDTAGKVADAAGKMADSLLKVQKWEQVGKGYIWRFDADVLDLTAAFYNASKYFNTGMLQSASNYSDTAGKVADATGKMADSLGKIRTWGRVGWGIINDFSADVLDLVAAFYNDSTYFDQTMTDSASRFADTAGKTGDAVSKAAPALNSIRNYKRLAEGIITAFAADLDILVKEFVRYGTQYDEDMNKAASNFAETGGKAADTVGKGVDAFERLRKYTPAVRANISQFVSDLKFTVDEFVRQMGKIDEQVSNAVKAFSDAGGSAAENMGKAVDGFNQLKNYGGAPKQAITNMVHDLVEMVNELDKQTHNIEEAVLTKVKSFGEATNSLFNGIAAGMKVFTDLNDPKYNNAAPEAIHALLVSIENAVEEASKLKAAADEELQTKVSAFGEACNKLFSGISQGMEVFNKLKDLKDIPSGGMDALLGMIQDTINKAASLNSEANTNLLGKADEFLGHCNNVFDQMKGAMDKIKGLEEYKNEPVEGVTAVLRAIQQAVDLMEQVVGESWKFRSQAEQYNENMTKAASAIASAPSPTVPGAPGGTVSDFNPSPRNFRGFATGGQVKGPIVVGENGPEVFFPGAMGGYVVNNAMARMSGLLNDIDKQRKTKKTEGYLDLRGLIQNQGKNTEQVLSIASALTGRATGGYTNRPTVVGENGPEAYIPNVQSNRRLRGSANEANCVIYQENNFTVISNDPEQAARAVDKKLGKATSTASSRSRSSR
jgi:TP901 family phage tail tape measure protein